MGRDLLRGPGSRLRTPERSLRTTLMKLLVRAPVRCCIFHPIRCSL